MKCSVTRGHGQKNKRQMHGAIFYKIPWSGPEADEDEPAYVAKAVKEGK